MELTELGEVFPILGSGLPRAPGLHLTDIIKYIQDTINPYTGKGFDDMQLTAEAGFWWEDMLSYIIGKRLGKRLNDVPCDGIYCNPDGIGYDPLDGTTPALEEYKLTWKSTKKLPIEDPKYMMQVKSYCHVLGTRVVVMYICYIMGNYKGSGPLSRSFRIEFTDQEIADNWAVILAHKDATIEALAEKDKE